MKLLEGFTVLDLGTFITAPYAAMLLAELGALAKIGDHPFDHLVVGVVRYLAVGSREDAEHRRAEFHSGDGPVFDELNLFPAGGGVG